MSAHSLPNDPFAARPVPVASVEVEESGGRIQVRHKTAELHGLRAFLARKFAMFPFRRVCLDEHGSFFWRQIDGRRTLAEIEENLRQRYELEPASSRDAVIVFTKMLMRRSLIALQLPGIREGSP